MSQSLGDAVLDLNVDQLPLDAGLDKAKAKIAAWAAETQRMLDRHIEVSGRSYGLLGQLVASKIEQPMSRVGGSLGMFAALHEKTLAGVRRDIAATEGSLTSLAATAKVTAAAQTAASKKVVASYAAEAAAAKASADAQVAAAARVAAARGAYGAVPEGGGSPAAESSRRVFVGAAGGETRVAPVTSGVWGVRGPNAPGSLMNPIVTVMEAGSRTPLGTLAAAIGESSAGAGSESATIARTRGSETTITTVKGSKADAAPPPVLRNPAWGPIGYDRGLERAMEVKREGDQERKLGLLSTLASVLSAEEARRSAPAAAVTASGPARQDNADDAALGAALAMGSRVQKAAILRRLAAEGRGHEVETLLAAGRGDGGGGNGGLLGLLGFGAGGGDNNNGSSGMLRKVLWGTGLFGLAGMGTLGSFAGLGPEHVLMTGLGLAGSATGAALGGGLIALGAAGQMAVGAGSDMAVMKSTLADTKSLETAYDNVGKAVALYGKNSEQAKLAQKELNLLMAELGNTAGVKAELGVAKAADALNEYWDKATSGARVQASKILMQGLGLGRTYIPLIAKAAERNLSMTNGGLRPLFSWLQGREGLGVFATLESRFKQNLPSALHAADQGVQLFLKTVREASAYTGGFTQALDRFFTKWNSPEYFSRWHTEMGRLVSDFHLWWTLVKVLGRDLYDLFANDAHTGQSIVRTLTQMLEKLGAWERSTKGKSELRNIFVLHREETIALMKALVSLASPFEKIYMTLAPEAIPIVTDLAKVVDWLATSLTSLGPGVNTLLGLALVAGKLGVLGSSIRGVGTALGILTAKETAAAAAGAQLAESETATTAASGGLLGRLAPSAMAAGPAGARLTSMIEGGSLGLAAGAERVGLSGVAGGIAAGGGMLAKGAPYLLPGMFYGGLGYLTGSSIASATGLHGTANSALSMAGLGAGIGAVAGPLGMLVGGLTGAGADLVGKMLFGGGGESKAEEGLKRLDGHIASLGGNLRDLSVKQLQEIHHEAERLGHEQHISKFANELAMLARETGPVAQAMRAMGKDFGQTAGEAGHSLSDIRGAVSNWVAWIKQTMPRGSAEANSAMAAAFLGGAKDIQASMNDGVISVSEGIEAMNKLMNEALEALGVKGGSHASLAQKKEALRLKTMYPEANAGFNSAGGPVEYRALGGLVQIGNAGEAGRDTVPLNVGGLPVMVAPGEQVAVFNRHQLPIVNTALGMMGYGGLPGLFQDVSTPHYMASGGVIHAPHVNTGGDVGALASAELRTVAAAMNRYVSAHTPRGGGVSTAGLSGSLVNMVHQIAGRMGWASQVGDWLNVIQRESGGSMTAKNPGSGAYGIAQFIEGPGAYAKYGGNVNTLAGQLVAMANYIKERYGGPAAAWAHELSAGWYSRGGLLGFAGGGVVPVGIGNYPQRATSRSFGHGAKHNPKPPQKAKFYGHGRPGETLTLPWRNPANASLLGLGNLLEVAIPGEQEHYSQLSNLDSLQEYTTFVSTEGPLGETVAPYINQGNVHGRLMQLKALLTTETTIRGQLERARALSKHLRGWIEREIAVREKRIHMLKRHIAEVRKEIEANLKKIADLNKHLAALEHPKHGKPNRDAIKHARAEIHALEKENRDLGGSPTSIGSGGELHHLESSLATAEGHKATLVERRGALYEDLKGIEGVGGSGGSLGETVFTLMQLQKQWGELQGPSLAGMLAKAQVQAGAGVGSEAATELLNLEKQRNENLAKELYASQQQYKVLAALPPFAGTFHTGGVIPGPVGAERMALVQAGERIVKAGHDSSGEGDAHVHLHFRPGTEWLRDFVDVRVQRGSRRTAAAASRPLPSGGGGQW